MSEAVTVAGGKPTLTLNDGGTATYTGGSGTKALTFSYTVGSTNSSVSSLAITAVNLPSGVTIEDSSGNAADMNGADTSFSGLSISSSDSPVTVAYYLANKAALDAAGNIAIADTAANISANFDALNADTHVTSIAPSGSGTPTLTLTSTQALNDTRALSILDPFTITVEGTAASLETLTAAQIASFSKAGVTLLDRPTRMSPSPPRKRRRWARPGLRSKSHSAAAASK